MIKNLQKESYPLLNPIWYDLKGDVYEGPVKTRNASSRNMIIIASATFVLLGLTWGGVRSPSSSANVLVLLVLDLPGVAFVAYEVFVPTMPIRNGTSINKKVPSPRLF